MYIPFTSRLENGLSTEPKRCNKMYKHDSPLLPYKMAIQNHNEDHTTEFKIKFRNLEKISLNYSGTADQKPIVNLILLELTTNFCQYTHT